LGRNDVASAFRGADLAGESSHSLQLNDISHMFGTTPAVEHVELSLRAGELVALLGPSGCGKSTLLRIVAGFLRQTSGQILFDGKTVNHLPANRRGVGIVFQNYALFPHLNVSENISYGLEAQGLTRQARGRRVQEMLELSRMGEFARRLPRQLSGGQQQRVALARALAVAPKLLLLDEPFAALDKDLRLDMQIEIKKLQRLTGVTTVIVTHDQEEALALADRVAVMSRGRVEQFGSPTEIYDNPTSLFVSRFVGTTNLLPGNVARIVGGEADIALDCGPTIRTSVVDLPAGARRALVSIRPHHLRVADASADDSIKGIVQVVMPMGEKLFCEIGTQDGAAVKLTLAREAGVHGPEVGSAIGLRPASTATSRAFAG
jgi:putative spermidine/putrescine transport system ATP-binding protein